MQPGRRQVLRATGTLALAARVVGARASETVSRELVVFAAASLRESFERLARAFEASHVGARVRLQLAGSQQLRTQIEHGATADVFAAADLAPLAALAAAKLVHPPVSFARNRLVVVVPAEPSRGSAVIARFADLPRAQRIVLGVSEVPIGRYADRLLTRAEATPSLGSAFVREVRARVVSRELDTRQVLAKVTLGEADAAIVYATDARAAATKVRAIALPAELDEPTEYAIATLTAAAQPELARALVGLVMSEHGQRLLQDSGFLPPASAARR